MRGLLETWVRGPELSRACWGKQERPHESVFVSKEDGSRKSFVRRARALAAGEVWVAKPGGERKRAASLGRRSARPTLTGWTSVHLRVLDGDLGAPGRRSGGDEARWTATGEWRGGSGTKPERHESEAAHPFPFRIQSISILCDPLGEDFGEKDLRKIRGGRASRICPPRDPFGTRSASSRQLRTTWPSLRVLVLRRRGFLARPARRCGALAALLFLRLCTSTRTDSAPAPARGACCARRACRSPQTTLRRLTRCSACPAGAARPP